MSSKKTQIISKESIQRLIKDVKYIIKNPLTDNNIYYKHDEEDMLKGYALIIGPSDTPYFGGFYFFEFNFPVNYPHVPPTVIFKTNGEKIRFNPNLYSSGKVCISLLNTWKGEQWTSCQSISSILLTLCTLLCSNPLLNEPGVSNTHNDCGNYNTIIEYKNIDIAILHMINKSPHIYQPSFDFFYDIIKESFKNNYEKLLSLVNKMIDDNKNTDDINISTNIYSMLTTINYKKLQQKLIKTYSSLQ
jgi:ubiquitin-protein ligase